MVAPGDSGVRLCTSEMCSLAETAQAATAGTVVAATPVGDRGSVLVPAMVAAVVVARTCRRRRRRRRRFLMVVAVMLTVGRLQETIAT